MTKKDQLNLGLGIYQILGGILGFVALGIPIFRNPDILGYPFAKLVFTVFFLLFVFSIVAGYLIIRSRSRLGINLTMINQFLQLFSFTVSGLGYKFVAGVALMFFVDFSQRSLGWHSELSAFNFEWRDGNTDSFLMINCAPVIVVYLATRVQLHYLR